MPHDPVAVVWTSGTTGKPKGAVFDHANLAAVARGTDVLSQPGDRRLSPLPFAHVGLHDPGVGRDRQRRDDGHHADAVAGRRRRPHHGGRGGDRGPGCADAVGADAGQPGAGRGPTSARCASPGRARRACRAALVAEVRRRFGVPVVVRYTSTEASLGTGTTLTSSDEEVATTVGRPVPASSWPSSTTRASPVPAGSVGRVLLRSAATMRGYWGRGPGRGRRVERADRRRRDGGRPRRRRWLTTGDFGRLTAEGNLQLSGRAHERYIRGGYNVYPAEVEEALSSHPAVARVAVVGVPDDVLGEIGVAVVVAAAGAVPDLAAAARALRPGAVRLQGTRRAGGRRRAAPDPDDEGRPGAPRRPGGSGAPRSAASRLAQNRGRRRRGARQWPHRRRRREGACMSPTTRVGESDPNRGTAPEAITPGRYRGQVAVVTGAGSGIGRATARRLAAEGAAVACLDVADGRHRGGGGRDQPRSPPTPAGAPSRCAAT